MLRGRGHPSFYFADLFLIDETYVHFSLSTYPKGFEKYHLALYLCLSRELSCTVISWRTHVIRVNIFIIFIFLD